MKKISILILLSCVAVSASEATGPTRESGPESAGAGDGFELILPDLPGIGADFDPGFMDRMKKVTI